jgi:hypothetical protein
MLFVIGNIDTHRGRYANRAGPYQDNEWSYVAQISYSLRQLEVLDVHCGLSKANRVAVINCLLHNIIRYRGKTKYKLLGNKKQY